MSAPVYLVGTGSCLPGEPIPFDAIPDTLGRLLDAPPAIIRWMDQTHKVMREILNIKYVHYAFNPITRVYMDDAVTMAVKAARQALDAAGINAVDVDLICYGSPHQDQMPTASVRIQEALGIERCEEFSIHANCTSSYKALYLAHQLIGSGHNKTALVISSNVASSELRSEYYNQPLVDKDSLFLRWFLSDGAGAAVVSTKDLGGRKLRVESTFIESIGGKKPSLMFNNRPAYWMNPKEEFETGRHHLRQKFRNELATSLFQEADGSVFFTGLKRMIARDKIPVERICYFQVNMPTRHIIDSILDECETIGIPRSSLYTRLDDLGYTGPPMSLMGLDSVVRNETISPGDRIVSFVTEVSKFMQAGYSIVHD